jgi:hypothetical protein
LQVFRPFLAKFSGGREAQEPFRKLNTKDTKAHTVRAANTGGTPVRDGKGEQKAIKKTARFYPIRVIRVVLLIIRIDSKS